MDTYILILGIASLLCFICFLWMVSTGFQRNIAWGMVLFFFSPLSAIFYAATHWYEAKKSFIAYMVTLMLTVGAGYLLINEMGVQRIQQTVAAAEAGEIQQNEIWGYLTSKNPLPGDDVLEGTQVVEAGTEVVEPGDITPADSASQNADNAATTITATEPQSQDKTSTPPASTASKQEAQSIVAKDDGPDVIVVKKSEPSAYPIPGQVQKDPLVAPKKPVPSDSVRVSLSRISHYKGRYFIVTTKKATEHRGILIKVTKTRIILERKIFGGSFIYKIRKTQIKRLDMLKKEYVEKLSQSGNVSAQQKLSELNR